MAMPAKPVDGGEFGTQRFEPDELVVAIPHLRAVTAALQKVLGVGDRALEVEPDDGLGLARVQLSTGSVVQALGADDDPVGRLLGRLTRDFAETQGGWTPVIGRNRTLDEVVGGEHTIGVGDEGIPQAVKDGSPLALREGDPGAGVLVGIADTVLHPSPWLEGAFRAPPAASWQPNGQPPRYQSGHATFVAGRVLRKAPGAALSVRRVLGVDGRADSWSVAQALVRFERLGVDVLNLSFGCFTDDNQPPLVLTAALDRLDPELVVVASAGNHALRAHRPLWPAALDRVVAVGATDDDGAVAKWSPEPQNWPWVDVLAPGVEVLSTYITGQVDVDGVSGDYPEGLARWSGTSFAAATVSGAVAARTVPGRTGAATALRELLQDPANRTSAGVPWIR